MESLWAGFALVVTGLFWLFFLKSPRIKVWMLLVASFFILLFFSIILMRFGIKMYVVLPYLVSSLTLLLASEVYRRFVTKVKTVFISYSNKDSDFARKLNNTLEKNRIITWIDLKMPPGKDLMRFIKESVRGSDHTVLVVSKNSLESDWVYKEFMETLIHEHVMETKKFLPVCIDTTVYGKDYQMKLVNDIVDRLKNVSRNISQLKEKSLSTENLEQEEKGLKDHQINLDKMLLNINNALAIDLSTDQKYNENISRLIKMIKDNKSDRAGS
jgi:hypothetical protein